MVADNGFITVRPDLRYGDSYGQYPNGYVAAQKFVALGSGLTIDISEIGAYVKNHQAGDNTAFRFSIWTHDAVHDCPESMVSNSESSELNAPDIVDIRFHTYSTKPQLTVGNTYWLALLANTDTSGVDLSRFASGGNSYYDAGYSYPTWPSSAQWETGYDSSVDSSFYVIYQDAEATTPAPTTVLLTTLAPTTIAPTTTSPTTLAPTTAPPTCENFLSWEAVEGATGYKVYVGTSPGVYDYSIDVGAITTYVLELSSGIYYVAITSYDGVEESDYGDEIRVCSCFSSCPPTTITLTTLTPTTTATTSAPTTVVPTTVVPTTIVPTTEITTLAPTTAVPLTLPPITLAPTTAPLPSTILRGLNRMGQRLRDPWR